MSGDCVSFDTREAAEDFIVRNPHRVRATQFMEVARVSFSILYFIAVYDFKVNNPLGEFSHYLREDSL